MLGFADIWTATGYVLAIVLVIAGVIYGLLRWK